MSYFRDIPLDGVLRVEPLDVSSLAQGIRYAVATALRETGRDAAASFLEKKLGVASFEPAARAVVAARLRQSTARVDVGKEAHALRKAGQAFLDGDRSALPAGVDGRYRRLQMALFDDAGRQGVIPPNVADILKAEAAATLHAAPIDVANPTRHANAVIDGIAQAASALEGSTIGRHKRGVGVVSVLPVSLRWAASYRPEVVAFADRAEPDPNAPGRWLVLLPSDRHVNSQEVIIEEPAGITVNPPDLLAKTVNAAYSSDRIGYKADVPSVKTFAWRDKVWTYMGGGHHMGWSQFTAHELVPRSRWRGKTYDPTTLPRGTRKGLVVKSGRDEYVIGDEHSIIYDPRSPGYSRKMVEKEYRQHPHDLVTLAAYRLGKSLDDVRGKGPLSTLAAEVHELSDADLRRAASGTGERAVVAQCELFLRGAKPAPTRTVDTAIDPWTISRVYDSLIRLEEEEITHAEMGKRPPKRVRDEVARLQAIVDGWDDETRAMAMDLSDVYAQVEAAGEAVKGVERRAGEKGLTHDVRKALLRVAEVYREVAAEGRALVESGGKRSDRKMRALQAEAQNLKVLANRAWSRARARQGHLAEARDLYHDERTRILEIMRGAYDDVKKDELTRLGFHVRHVQDILAGGLPRTKVVT